MTSTLRASLLRRSLAAQAVLLTLLVTVIVSVALGWLASWRLAAWLTVELDRRGSAMAAMLERHKDLHAAVLQRDAEAASEVLQQIVAGDREVEYVALLDPRGRPLAAAAREAGDPLAAVRAQLPHHPLSTPGLAESDRRTQRFTQAVAADQGEKGVWAGQDEQLYAPGTTIGYLVLGMRDRSAAVARWYAAALVAGVGLALAAAFLVFFLRLARRLRRCLCFAEQLAGRDLAADLPDHALDEVGRVAGALRAIRDRTRAMVAELRAAVEALRGSSAAMHGNAQAQRARAEGQAARIAGMHGTVLELERAAQAARDHAEGVIQAAARRGQQAEEGRRAVAEGTGAIELLRGEVMRTADALQDLAGHSARIDEIARTVAELADRSHVLAINTGIEAARVGDEGHAFRIVAREMRELADGSRSATGRVRAMLSEIARAAGASRAAAAAGNERADAAAGRALQAARAIDELAAALAGVVDTATRIAEGTRSQAQAIEAISLRMGEVGAEAEGAAAQIAGLEGASQEVLARAERLRATVGEYRGA